MVRVSVILPAHNAGRWVERAVRSALAQTMPWLEVLVAENGSADDTAARVQTLAEEDSRVRLLRADRPLGPGGARNMALDAARGEWIALLDADDSFAPDRLERLLPHAAAYDAAIVADNQRLMAGDGSPGEVIWPWLRTARLIDAPFFVRHNIWGRDGYGLGYAKPLIRREAIERRGLRYDPALRIAEDFHFLLALLMKGERMLLAPRPFYNYTRRPDSLTARLSERDAQSILQATERALAESDAPDLTAALQDYRRSLLRMAAHVRFIECLKARRPLAAGWVVARRPGVVPLIVKYGRQSIAKRLPGRRPRAMPKARPAMAFFGQNAADSAVIRRIASFQEAGLDVLGLTFRRATINRDYVPAWTNIALGTTRDRDYRGRAISLVKALVPVARQRRRLRQATFFYARNIDMAFLALFGRAVSGSRAPFVYEVLDVHAAFLRPGPVGGVLRWMERRILARTRMLVVSSPAYISAYFRGVQGYRGDWFLLENKILRSQLEAMTSQRQSAAKARLDPIRRNRIVIGWFGALRCARSLSLLAEICRLLPGRVLVYMRGYPTTELHGFHDVVERHENMIYDGEFFSPRDLPDIYGAIDLAWCFDYFDRGGNSDWLLPNRLYDGGFFGVPALAAEGTQVGRTVAENGLGWTFSEPVLPNLVAFLGRVDPQEIAKRRAHITALPRSLFCDDGEVRRLVVALLGDGPRRGPASAAGLPPAEPGDAFRNEAGSDGRAGWRN